MKAFAIVEGATLSGEAGPGESVTARTDVTVGGASFIYERTATADEYAANGERATAEEPDEDDAADDE
ncbi:hypothetical protein [Halegenticoccus tardaugens]|uniref:hypothetical protein n=1 Tax=Halegenticoccus tardaugens TaxID=2071624 RepID=UPI00100B9733|nr:hypothetical protein [Halegenticoccus tardaugens]